MILPKPSEVINSLVNKYKTVKNSGDLPFWLIFSIAIYIPFEDFTLTWLPLPEPVKGVLRILPEVFLYGFMINILWNRFFISRNLKSTPIDILLVFFFASSIISIILNGSGLFSSILTLRILWRYLSVFYIVVNIDISIDQLSHIFNGIKVVGVIQGVLAALQYIMPPSFLTFFTPSRFKLGDYEKISLAKEGLTKAGSAIGTFDQPDVLASFLLLVVVVTVSFFFALPRKFKPKLKELSSLAILYFGIFASKKRIALILGLVIPFFILGFQKKIRKLLKLGWMYALISFSLFLLIALIGTKVDTSFTGSDSRESSIDLISYFIQIFSPDLYEHSSEHARGWVFQTIVPIVFKSGNWFGFGPDLENMRHIIFDLLTNGSDRAYILELVPIEDVYWVAMLGYYGPVGIAIYSFILWRLFQTGRWLTQALTHPEYKSLGSLFCTLVITLVIYNFVSRIILLRPFSYCFWLSAGLVVNIYNRYQPPRSIALEINTSDSSKSLTL